MDNAGRHLAVVLLLGLLGCPAEDEPSGGTMALTQGAGTDGHNEDDHADEDESDSETENENEDEDDGSNPPDDDSDDSNSGPSDDSGPETTTDDSGPATTGPSGETGDDSLDTGADPELQMCLDMAVDMCEECACNNCLPELTACQADPGCVAIRMCAQENGCTGIGCLGPCGDVIDANGGAFGPSAGLASTLSDCYTAACPGC